MLDIHRFGLHYIALPHITLPRYTPPHRGITRAARRKPPFGTLQPTKSSQLQDPASQKSQIQTNHAEGHLETNKREWDIQNLPGLCTILLHIFYASCYISHIPLITKIFDYTA
jgi:hypothetical protein